MREIQTITARKGSGLLIESVEPRLFMSAASASHAVAAAAHAALSMHAAVHHPHQHQVHVHRPAHQPPSAPTPTPPPAPVPPSAETQDPKLFPQTENDDGGGSPPVPEPQNVPNSGGLLPASPAPASGSWVAVGPGPITSGQVPGGGAVSGRLTAIAPSPTDPKTIYIGAAGGGVWKTTDSGSTWAPLTDAQTTDVIGALALAPSNPNIIYAGTGEANNSGDSYYGRGILKSIDGGATWTLLGNSVFNRNSFSKIVVDPANANIVYATTSYGVNGTYGGWGIWKSTDGGVNWTETTTSINSGTTPCSDLVMDPTNSQVLYGAMGYAFGDSHNGIYKTTNAGASWTLLSAFPGNAANNANAGRITLGMTTNPQVTTPVLYATVQNTASSGLLGAYRSANGGAAWTTLSPPNYMGGQGWYDQTIAVLPSDLTQNTVYLSGSAGTNSMLQSTNGGTSWTDISTGASGNNGPHADHHAAAFDANGHYLDGDDGGIWRLDNATPGSIAWTDLNSNLNITQFIGVAIGNTTTPVLFGGSQDNGTSQSTGGAVAWTEREGGDGGAVAISPNLASRIYHIAPVGSFGSSDYFRRSDNGGTAWNSEVNGLGASDPSNFYPPFVVDPNSFSGNDRLLLGTNRVYESVNNAASWTPISTPNSGGWTVSTNIDTLAVAASDVNTIYASSSGHTFVTTNRGASWTEHDVDATNNISQIIVDPTSSMIAYAVLDRFGGGKIYRTVNGGATWANISGNLPDLPAHAVVLDPKGPGTADDVLYLGTDQGVFTSSNFTATPTWSLVASGLPPVPVLDLKLNSNHILAAGTHGRGMWQTLVQPPVITAISGQVFNDANGNGVKDSAETGLAGWTVYLDQNGNHTFDSGVINPSSTDVPKAIPDGPGGQVTSTLAVSGTIGNIANITCTLSINHTFDSDLQAYLISPTNTRIELFSGDGGSGHNFTATTFSDAAATPISSGSAPFSGSYTPDDPLSTFNGQGANGVWSLEVHDNAAVDTGTIISWSLAVTSGEPNTTTDASGNYIFSGLTAGAYSVGEVHHSGFAQTAPSDAQPNSGLYTINLATGTTASGTNFGNIADSKPPTLSGAVSRKTQGSAGTFDLPLDISGSAANATVEPRRAHAGDLLVLNFSENILGAGPGGAALLSQFTATNGVIASATISGNTLTLGISSVTDQAVLSIALGGITDLAGNPLSGVNTIYVRELEGNVTQSKSVSVLDFQAVKTHLLDASVDSSNFLSDVDCSGTIDILDFQEVKTHLFDSVI
ncbi:MAG: glycosyl hydrolase [Phycisphaerales bacterium]|nr:glycosyl hydrolase [Phycisphaerales bacterium]